MGTIRDIMMLLNQYVWQQMACQFVWDEYETNNTKLTYKN